MSQVRGTYLPREEVYKLLPGTNCRACADASCFVLANKLVSVQVGLQDCPVLEQTQYTKEQAHLADLLAIGQREE